MGYQQCSDTLAAIELVDDKKAEDSYDECIRDKYTAYYSLTALEQEECRDSADYARADIAPSAWQTDNFQLPRLCDTKYRSCYLDCGGTVRLGDFELKPIETEITQVDKLEVAPVLNKACNLGSVQKCCEDRYNQCIVEPQRRKIGTDPYTERAPEPMKGQATGQAVPSARRQVISEQ
jgi:hypothetical protein